MRTRTVALLTAAAVLAATGATGPAQAAEPAGSGPAAGCGTAGYPAGYGIWCPGRLHLVTEGDSLYGLAQAYLGRGDLWPEISVLGTASPARCNPAGSRPTEIFPGQILLIPFSGTAAPGQPASCPSGAAPAPSAVTSPGGAVSAPGQHGRSAGARGVPAVVPGTLAPRILAVLGLAAVVLLARAVRRRRRKPRTAATGPGDGELVWPAATDAGSQGAPLPGGPEAGSYHDRPHCAGQNPDPCGPGQFPGAGRQAARSVPQPASSASPAERSVLPQTARFPIGTRDGGPVTADLATLGGLGLTGPGAAAAARAIAGAVLSRPQGGRGGPSGQVIVPAADAAGLLSPAAPGAAARPVPGLSRPPTLAAALDETEILILSRARLAEAGDDEDGPGTGATAAGITAALMAVPDPAATQRLRTITGTARRLGIAVIMLGSWPYGTTCHVAADGTITGVTPADPGLHGVRLFRLTPGELVAITSPASPARQAPAAARIAAPAAERPASPAAGIPPAPGPRPPGRAISTVPEAAPAPADPAPTASPVSPAGRPVRIGVLGPLRITAAGREVGGGPRKARELLAFLAVQGQEGATAEQISEALWPGLPPGRGTSQRNTALRKARELLRQSAGLPSPMWITLTSDRYRLDPALMDIDLRDFQSALRTARDAGSPQSRLAACRQAAGCYRGPLCDGAGYDWAEPYAEAARRHALDNWAHIAEILRDTDPEQAMAALEAAITHDPYNEYTYQQLMRLQAQVGRTDAVRRTLQLLRARLKEIGVPAVAASTRQVIAGLLDGTGPHPAAGPAQDSPDSTRRPGPRTSPGLRRLQANTRQAPVQTPPQAGTAAGRKSRNAAT
jgi:DNA-binding SARP family transcriptional activator